MILKKLILGTTAATIFSIGTFALASNNSLGLGIGKNAAENRTHNNGFYIRGEGSFSGTDSIYQESLYQEFTSKGINFISDETYTSLRLNNKKSQGFSGRAAIGYDFTPFLSVETGIYFIHPVTKNFIKKITHSEKKKDGIVTKKIVDLTLKNSEINLHVNDLLVKKTIPFKNNFYIFIKGGVAYIQSKTDVTNSHATYDEKTLPDWKTNEYTCGNTSLSPEVAAGVGYNFGRVALDVSYARIFGKGEISQDNYLPSLNFTSVGVTYKF